ncbi:MAG: hypothetical protein KTR31_01830 [Myxococcales bacterium]|nr:hypothetical protein [Myxococcales bacterium]
MRTPLLLLAASCAPPGPSSTEPTSSTPSPRATAEPVDTATQASSSWSRRFGDEAYQGLDALQTDSTGAVWAMGRFAGTLVVGDDVLVPEVSGGAQEVYLLRLSDAGSPLWARSMGAIFAWDAAMGPGDQLWVCGQTTGAVNIDGTALSSWAGAYVATFGPDGALRWARAWPGLIELATLQENHVATTATGHGVLAGTFSEAASFGGPVLDPEGFDVYAVGLTSEGKRSWSTQLGGLGAERVSDVTVDDDGNTLIVGTYDADFTVAGDTLVAGPGESLFVAKLDESGAPLWGLGFPADVGRRMAIDTAPSGDVVIVFELSRDTDFGGGLLEVGGLADVGVARFTTEGEHVFSRIAWGAGVDDPLGDLVVDDTGNAVITGTLSGPWDFGDQVHEGIQGDPVVLMLDPEGETVFSALFGGAGVQWGREVALQGAGIVVGAVGYEGIDFGDGPLPSEGDVDVFLHRMPDR